MVKEAIAIANSCNITSTSRVTGSKKGLISNADISIQQQLMPLQGYDVIFTDFMMPKMNGPDATRAIRALGYTGPIIGVTGNAHEEDKDIFINAGATGVIIKPLKMAKLLEVVDL